MVGSEQTQETPRQCLADVERVGNVGGPDQAQEKGGQQGELDSAGKIASRAHSFRAILRSHRLVEVVEHLPARPGDHGAQADQPVLEDATSVGLDRSPCRPIVRCRPIPVIAPGVAGAHPPEFLTSVRLLPARHGGHLPRLVRFRPTHRSISQAHMQLGFFLSEAHPCFGVELSVYSQFVG